MEASQPPQQPPPMPTPEDAQAIFTRADEAARRAETAAQRLEAAQGAARQETESRFEGMPEEMVKQISEAAAKSVVEALNRQYEVTTPPTQPPGPAQSSTSGEGGVSAESGQEGGGSKPRPSLADRILGTSYRG